MHKSVLLSIRPEYAMRIVMGIKKYEFRKRTFGKEGIHRVYIYATSPVKKIVGFFEIETILEGSPKEIWKICSKNAGIDEAAFFEYYRGKEKAYSIKVGDVKVFDPPICPYIKLENFHPPQSYMYVDDNHLINEKNFSPIRGNSCLATARDSCRAPV